jgi:hypothetical protein
MTPGSSYIHTDGMSVREPGNPRVRLTFVGTQSEHDPSWEVRTLPKIPTDLPYPPAQPSPWSYTTVRFYCLITCRC